MDVVVSVEAELLTLASGQIIILSKSSSGL